MSLSKVMNTQNNTNTAFSDYPGNSQQNNIQQIIELFRRNLRESNLTVNMQIDLANTLLNEDNGHLTREQLDMGNYCLQKAHELARYDADILNNYIMINNAQQQHGNHPVLKSRLSFLKNHSKPDGKVKLGIQYLRKNNYEKANHYFQQSGPINPQDIETISLLTEFHTQSGNPAEALNLFAQAEPSYRPQNPFYSWFWGRYGQTAYLSGDYQKTEWCLEKTLISTTPVFINLLAELKLRTGQAEEAIKLWEQSLRQDSLQPILYLKMHDVLNNYHTLKEEQLNNYNINTLLYTFNKHDMFKATIDGLAKTDIGNARILLLDNNCIDGTREFMQTAQNLFPNNPVKVINLPTNIGAPAARNWLMKQPENDDTDFIAYLDDDVILPRDWLKRLVGTMNAHPQAGVVGTKVVNQGNPKTIQYIYRYLDIITENRLGFSSKHLDEPDFGQFDVIRKCLSVMGCCHLFRTKCLNDVGEFDIRFSPSQVDDIDHDFLTCLKKYEIIYNGYIEVVHCQKAGKSAFVNRAAMGNIMGNDHKFAMKHETDEMLKLKAQTEEQDKLDIKHKINDLKTNGYLKNIPEVPFDVI